MGQILNYDTVIEARAAGRYHDVFINDSHPSGAWSWITGSARISPSNGWYATAENKFDCGVMVKYDNVAALSAGGTLFSADSARGAPKPPIPVPANGRQRWLTYVETSLLHPGMIVGDLLWACQHLMSNLTDSGTSPALRRYADGKGVQIVAWVSTTALTYASETVLTVTYTNQDGVGGRTAKGNFKANAPNGSCASGRFWGGVGTRIHASPYLELQQGDTGVRAITAIGISNASASRYIVVALVFPLVSVAPVPGSSLRSEDLLAKPEGAAELVIGSDGQHGAMFTLLGVPHASATYLTTGLTRLATVEV